MRAVELESMKPDVEPSFRAILYSVSWVRTLVNCGRVWIRNGAGRRGWEYDNDHEEKLLLIITLLKRYNNPVEKSRTHGAVQYHNTNYRPKMSNLVFYAVNQYGYIRAKQKLA